MFLIPALLLMHAAQHSCPGILLHFDFPSAVALHGSKDPGRLYRWLDDSEKPCETAYSIPKPVKLSKEPT